MDPMRLASIGKTEVEVTRLGLGGAPMGGLFTDVAERQAKQTLEQAYQGGVRYFDTAPLYGSGKSEKFFGAFLSKISREDFVLSTKVGRVLDPTRTSRDDDMFENLPDMEVRFDFSRDGVLRSIEDSLDRLGLDKIDIVLIHDPDEHFEQAISESFPTLAELRSQGVIGAVGAGMNQWEMLARFANEGDFDCFLLAGRYTLLDFSALTEFMPLCLEKNISVILGGPYNSGILASDLGPDSTYFYEKAPSEVIARAQEIRKICNEFSVPLKAAALQFGLLHPAVTATIPGAREPSEVSENIEMASLKIPLSFWNALKSERLIPAEVPTG